MNIKKLLQVMVIATIILGFIAYFMVWQPFSVSGHSYDHPDNVTICHATGSQNNPYNEIEVDSNAVDGYGNGDHNSNRHHSGADIIPPFYNNGVDGFWNSRNWDSEGQVIWYNHCDIPISPIPTPTPTDIPIDCEEVIDECLEYPEQNEACNLAQEFCGLTFCDIYPQDEECQEVDVCLNIEGNQETLPDGYHFEGGDSQGFEEAICVENPIPTPTPTPSPTPALEPEIVVHKDDWNLGGPPVRTCANIEHAPTILGWDRLSSTSVKIWWSETAPQDDYHIFYGLSKDNLVWNVVVENSHEVVLNGLPKDLHIWVQVKASDGICEGEGSEILDP